MFSAQKNQKPRKAKASELKRANKKLLENEKVDKDDSSSTTTETSSIEADEKVWVKSVPKIGAWFREWLASRAAVFLVVT